MALPLYLAMTAAEMSSIDSFPEHPAYMACHFSPYSQGLSNLPPKLPPHTLLILDDRFPCQGHSPGLVADQLNSITDSFHCENLLLDFQRPPDAESSHMVQTIASQLVQNPVVPPAYCHDPSFPVFLPPCPLHLTMEEYIAPWCNREIWLEAGLCQESISIESDGAHTIPQFPPEGLEGGFFDEALSCRYFIRTEADRITFTLYDTRETLKEKLEKAHRLGVSRAVGLYQELGKKGKNRLA